jgi:hypothetical protein
MNGQFTSVDHLPIVRYRVLFLIKSAIGNFLRRSEQEARWLCALPQGSDYYFCIGGEETGVLRVDGHHLFLPVIDSYDFLPAKMKAMVAWAADKTEFDYVITMDDDVVIELSRLYSFLCKQPDHFGNQWDGNPRHISGMLVGYSRRAFSILNEHIMNLPDQGADDLLVSSCVFESFRVLNVMTDELRFRPYGMNPTPVTIAIEVRPFRPNSIKDYSFGPSEPRNKVSFCLYGRDPKYTKGAIVNAGLVPKFYPGWEAVFHIRDVDYAVKDELRALGATVVECDHLNMMLSRFLPFCDEGAVLSRDCDSRIGQREVRAVTEWLESEKPAHVIRDHPGHIPGWALIPGGLWGSRLPFGENLRNSLLRALNDPQYSGWGGDQRWLVENVWREEAFVIHQYTEVEWMRNTWSEYDFCGMPVDVNREFQNRQVILFEGFFNRLNGLVNAWLTYGPGFHATWAVNAHLPHPVAELFSSFPGVEVTEQHNLGYWPENTDPSKGPLCYWYLNRRCGASPDQVEEAYRHFISRLKVRFDVNPPTLGVHYRGLHHSARLAPTEFAAWCLNVARARNLQECFLVADSNREEIRKLLVDGGMKVNFGQSAPLAHDLDRKSSEELRKFIGDALTLAHCKTILTSFAESTVIDPAKAYRREVIHCTGSRAWSECWFHHQSEGQSCSVHE